MLKAQTCFPISVIANILFVCIAFTTYLLINYILYLNSLTTNLLSHKLINEFMSVVVLYFYPKGILINGVSLESNPHCKFIIFNFKCVQFSENSHRSYFCFWIISIMIVRRRIDCNC